MSLRPRERHVGAAIAATNPARPGIPGPARRLVGPGLLTLAMLAALIALGNWQIHRLAWKQALLAEIARAEASPGVPLSADPAPFAKVVLQGTFRTDLDASYGVELRRTLHGDQLGAQVLTPLERPDGPAVLVDRGWAPSDDPGEVAQPSGPVTVEGYVRPAEQPGLFTPADDPGRRVFYALDPRRIALALGLSDVAPFTVVALGTPPPSGYPAPATGLPRPPNDHLSYALTWYGLAAVLAVVFSVYVRKVLRA